MPPRTLLSRLPHLRHSLPPRALPHPRKPPPQTRHINTETTKTTTRASRILSRLPRPLQKYTARLRNAPLSHVVAFLILHEITAVIPLFGLFGVFHYTELIPVGYVLERYGGWVGEGAGRAERYFRRKGWFGFIEGEGEGEGEGREMKGEGDVLKKWEGGDGRYRVVVEVALAYALTKAMLPLRVVASVWATPWFAGVLGRVQGLMRFRRR
ncbi:hypothetical protein B0T16DRAFT_85023 [Cercophora newfieldiana]|uniref:Uncharacterized protein n=1 Tax=Cercophora newfieldiana TaxID=92897 RepID=A0AA39YFJ2_9PEZI|nr:hypothetical protein B0T16DRAFT_85023 [Cercophora newfieldiana]